LKDAHGGVVAEDAGQVILANCTSMIVENQDMRNTSVGVLLGFCTDVVIVNNSISESANGVLLYSSNGNTVGGNNVSMNEYGVSLEYSHHNLISGNDVFLTVRSGINLHYSDSNVITENNVRFNGKGISLDSSSSNRVFHNDFVANSVQAWDDETNNLWDDDYPSGGNFWGDYSGIDEMSGPQQDRTGGDGIGDTQYDIAGGSRTDRYPLMEPFMDDGDLVPDETWLWVGFAVIVPVFASMLIVLLSKKWRKTDEPKT